MADASIRHTLDKVDLNSHNSGGSVQTIPTLHSALVQHEILMCTIHETPFNKVFVSVSTKGKGSSRNCFSSPATALGISPCLIGQPPLFWQRQLRRSSGSGHGVCRRATRVLSAAVLGAAHETTFLLRRDGSCNVRRDVTRLLRVGLRVNNLGLNGAVRSRTRQGESASARAMARLQ